MAKAASYYRQAGDLKRALKAYIAAKDFLSAASIELSFGRGEEAAKLYLQAGRFDILADFYEKRNEFDQAVHFYRRAGNFKKAAEMGEKLLENLPTINAPTDNIRKRSEKEKQLIRLTASNHSRAQNFKRAAHLFHKIGLFDKEASNHLKNGEFYAAGVAFERIKMYGDAGEAYSRADHPLEAAKCYEKNNDNRLAADHYYKAKKYKKAGQLYQTTGNILKATQAYDEGGEYDLALKVLAGIKPDNDWYDDAIKKAIELTRKKGYVTPASHRMFSQYMFREIDRQHFPSLFEIAVLMEDSELAEEAEIIFNRLEKFDLPLYLEYQNKKSELSLDDHAEISIEEILEEDYNVTLILDRNQNKAEHKSQDEKVIESATNVSVMSKDPRYLKMNEGQMFGNRYVILEQIGSGGMGIIYKAKDLELEELLVIKILSPAWSDDANLVARFKREIKLARLISHNNVIRIYDLGNWEGYIYITMEYFQGSDLAQIIAEKGAFNISDGLNLCIQLCEGLNAAHQQGIIHRDLKSSNIMISEDNTLKLLDFGIAKAANVTQLTIDGSILGTPYYISPEAIMQKEVDNRSDIYSLGIVMFEIFTGRCPYEGDYLLDVMQKHLSGNPPTPSSIVDSIPEDLDEIILKCIAMRPEKRYQSIAELISELKMVAMFNIPE